MLKNIQGATAFVTHKRNFPLFTFFKKSDSIIFIMDCFQKIVIKIHCFHPCHYAMCIYFCRYAMCILFFLSIYCTFKVICIVKNIVTYNKIIVKVWTMKKRTTDHLQQELMDSPDLARFLTKNENLFVNKSIAELLNQLFERKNI